MPSRAFIDQYDTTTSGGKLKPTFNGVTTGANRIVCFEGTPVDCPRCKSTGYTRCIPPFRPYTGHDGRQINLDGDLCICKCSPPPRLIGAHPECAMGFSSAEIAATVGSDLWRGYAEQALTLDFHDEQFMLLHESGAPMSEMAYTVRIKSTGATMYGMTDKDGMTQRIRTSSGGAADIEIFWGAP